MAEREKIELVELTSFKTLQVEGPEYQQNLEDDAWSYGAPPPKGVYEFKWFPAKEGAFKSGYTKKGDASTFFIQLNVEGHLVDDKDWEGIVATAYLTSRIGRGKEVSPLVGWLIAGGQKTLLDKYNKDRKLTPKQQGVIAEALLKKEPVIRAEIDWRGSYSMANPKGGDNDIWVNVANKYEDFPQDPNDKSKRVHVYTTTGKDGLPKEIRAQIRVTRFLAKGEEYKPNKIAVVGSNGMIAPVLIQESAGVELEAEAKVVTPTLVSQPRPVKVNAPPVVPVGEDQESLDLMLAD